MHFFIRTRGTLIVIKNIIRICVQITLFHFQPEVNADDVLLLIRKL